MDNRPTNDELVAVLEKHRRELTDEYRRKMDAIEYLLSAGTVANVAPAADPVSWIDPKTGRKWFSTPEAVHVVQAAVLAPDVPVSLPERLTAPGDFKVSDFKGAKVFRLPDPPGQLDGEDHQPPDKPSAPGPDDQATVDALRGTPKITPHLLAQKVGCTPVKAGNIIFAWNSRGWLRRVDRGVYEPTPLFGAVPVSAPVVSVLTTAPDRPTPAKAPAPPPKASAAARPAQPESSGNADVAPCSARGVEIGRTLVEPFTALDLSARLDGPRGRENTWLARWTERGWLAKVGPFSYRRSDRFGQM